MRGCLTFRPTRCTTGRDGDAEPIHIDETDTTFAIGWKGHYRIEGRHSSTLIATQAEQAQSSDIRRIN